MTARLSRARNFGEADESERGAEWQSLLAQNPRSEERLRNRSESWQLVLTIPDRIGSHR